GIRDFHVTGVQTCALPILAPQRGPRERLERYRPPVRALQRDRGKRTPHQLPGLQESYAGRWPSQTATPASNWWHATPTMTCTSRPVGRALHERDPHFPPRRHVLPYRLPYLSRSAHGALSGR